MVMSSCWRARVLRVCGALLLLAGLTAQGAEFNTRADRAELAVSEPLTLSFSLVNSETRLRAEGESPNIDLSVLARDFDVGRPKVNSRYNIDLGRGRSSSEISVELFPRRAGRFTIPAFEVDGLRSAPLSVNVVALPPDAIPDVFSRGGVSKSSVWQREHFVTWLDVYHRVPLKSASMGEYIDSEPLRIELMEHRELPQSVREETVKGTTYQVTRSAWAIFPKEAGTLKIILPDVWLVTADERKVRLPHQFIDVAVRALPAAVSAEIVVGLPQLSQTPPAPAPAVNQFSTWTVTVSGAFSRFALPDSLPLPPVPKAIKLYADQAQRESEVHETGVTTQVRYGFSAMPQQGGKFILPPLTIPYFNTERGELDVMELAGPALEVEAAADTAVATQAATLTSAAPRIDAGSNAPHAHDAVRPWQISTAVFALLWLASAALLWRWRARRPATVTQHKPARTHAKDTPPAQHPLQARLLAAFGSRSLELGLREWEQTNGREAALRETVQAVQRLCYGKERERTAATPQLQQAVEKAVTIIRHGMAPTQTQRDMWRPESFSSGK